jgi:acyl carrier protein
MGGPAISDIETGVVDVLKHVSRRPIEPARHHDLVADLGFDSLEVLELVAGLEDRFGIALPVEEVPNVRTVAQVIDHVARLVAARAPAP